MTPVANFLVSPALLTVTFTDSSTGTPTSWDWDFGDSTTHGTTQNPVHTYTTAGKKVVKLIATNSGGSSSLQREIVVSTVPILPVSLKTFVNIKLAASGLAFTEETKEAFIAQAQLEIQPLVFPEISELDVFNELVYPPLANALVAYMASYKALLNVVAGSAAAGSTSGTGANAGAIKKIVTGPSQVEYQDLANLHKNFFGTKGVLDALQLETCGLARRLNIQLIGVCPDLPKPKFAPVKAGRKLSSLHDPNSVWQHYPFFIPITC